MQRVGTFFDRIALSISAFTLASVSLVVILQVIVRYIFSFSFPWADELSRFLMIWTCFIGASCVVKRMQLANVNIFDNYMSPKAVLVFKMLANLVSLLFLIMVVYTAVKQISSPTFLMQKSPAMRLPMFWAYLCVPLGSLFMCWHLFEQIIDKMMQWRSVS